MPEHYGENAGAIGTGIGAVVGLAATGGNPMGAKIGSMAGQAIGGTIGGMMQRRAANQLQPSPVDPLTSSMLQETRRRRRAFETGAAFSEANKGIQSSLATTQKNILRRSGGSVGAAISGMAMAQRGAAEQMGRLQTQGMQLANQVAAQEQSVAQRIAQRRLELQLLRQRQLQAQGQEDYSTGMQNIMAGAANIGDINLKTSSRPESSQNLFSQMQMLLTKPKGTVDTGVTGTAPTEVSTPSVGVFDWDNPTTPKFNSPLPSTGINPNESLYPFRTSPNFF